MRRLLILVLVLLSTVAALGMPTAAQAGGSALRDSVDDLQQEIESLTEDIEDLGEPVAEFELFDQCAYTLGVTSSGPGTAMPGTSSKAEPGSSGAGPRS